MTVKGSNNSKQILEDIRREQQAREGTYRERALKIYPWICAHCGREFEGKRLKELTVHHKDHNHDNNPPDGSNWELLCIYCHDNEHSRDQVADAYGDATSEGASKKGGTTNPFAGLGDLLKGKLG
ncbi:YajD family HNH nuclease [Desulfobacula sp.]|uniref:YajD family HNH nuclease n=1 Tax=Desulfobacula sp. TaxID=2593537 RepID=UPI00262BF004|nr:YajD family HNH nuclease [Desulfobacula sp.]